MKRKRQAVWDKTNGHCCYCGVSLVIGEPSNYESRKEILKWFAIDHQVPKTMGGDNDPANLVPACWLCNSTKGHKSIEEYRLYLSMRDAGMPFFTVEQITWLQRQGFKVNDVEPISFWFERQGLDLVTYERTE